MNFDVYELQDKTLQLGEDRDDRAIKVSLESCRVSVGTTDQFMNKNLALMRHSVPQS